MSTSCPSRSESCTCSKLLQHLHDETFQISRLRHAGEDGMVGALASLFDQANLSLGVACCEADALPEICLRDRMGTGARHKKPFRLQQLQTQEIDVLITS